MFLFRLMLYGILLIMYGQAVRVNTCYMAQVWMESMLLGPDYTGVTHEG